VTAQLELGPGDLDNWVGSPRYPDPIVFGPPGADPNRVLHVEYDGPPRICECAAQWHGNAPCWACGGPATGI
jgi:hypothetical protein